MRYHLRFGKYSPTKAGNKKKVTFRISGIFESFNVIVILPIQSIINNFKIGNRGKIVSWPYNKRQL